MAENKTDWSWVPKREWEWPDGKGTAGVHTYEGQLVWWGRPAGPTGYMFENASVQSFQEFLLSGAPVMGVPVAVLEELETLLRSQG
jgi:hypothetical protein